jgi:aminoglycoside phosphotransferase (APT) family kinase protein
MASTPGATRDTMLTIMVVGAVPDGIDGQRVSAWLAEHVADATPPFRYELITGGRSNLTYCATDASGHRFVVRRPPPGTLLATAHDVAREWRIVTALAKTPVPVPIPVAVCEDTSVNGAPFAVTRFVEGVVLDLPEKAATLLDDAGRRDIAYHLIDVLADLHAVDLHAVGLAGLSRHDGYVERQLRRWSKQWEGSRTRDLPLIDELEKRLVEDIPRQRGVALVHGDYRFGNCITDVDKHRIAAVLDWELCTLGDAMADLGHMSVYWHDPARPLPLTNDPTAAGGFPPYDDLLHRYAARTGRDVLQIGYYRAFAAWRLAIIAEGVASRHRERHPEDVAALKASRIAVERLAESALASVG